VSPAISKGNIHSATEHQKASAETVKLVKKTLNYKQNAIWTPEVDNTFLCNEPTEMNRSFCTDLHKKFHW
jgi:hypothetical protein